MPRKTYFALHDQAVACSERHSVTLYNILTTILASTTNPVSSDGLWLDSMIMTFRWIVAEERLFGVAVLWLVSDFHIQKVTNLAVRLFFRAR